MVKYNETSWCVSQTKLLELKAACSEKKLLHGTEMDYLNGQQVQCQIHYLNKPKRANKSMTMSKSSLVSLHKTVIEETDRKPSLHRKLLEMCNEKPNLCEEMNYAIATSPKKKKCGCVYRHQACRIHMYHCDSSFSSSKTSFALSAQLNMESEVCAGAHTEMKLPNKNFIQKHNTTTLPSFQYTPMHSIKSDNHCNFPMTYKMPKKNHLHQSNFKWNCAYDEMKKNLQTSVGHKYLTQKPQKLMKFASKRPHGSCGLQVTKKCKVDLNDVCQLQDVPDPKRFSFEGYNQTIANYFSKRLLAIRIASMFPKIESEVQSKSGSYLVKLPQTILDLINEEMLFFGNSQAQPTTPNLDGLNENVSSQNYFLIKNQPQPDKLHPLKTLPDTTSSVMQIENQDKHQDEEKSVCTQFESSRKSKRLKRKRDLGIQGPYQTDYLVEIPSVKKSKRLCRPFGNNCFWNFYHFFYKTQKMKWKHDCYKYLKLLIQLPYIKKTQWSENQFGSVFQRFITTAGSTSCGESEHTKDSTSSDTCSYCCLPFDGMSNFEKAHHTNRHRSTNIKTLVAPVTFMRKLKQIKKNNHHTKKHNGATFKRNFHSKYRIQRPVASKNFYKAEQHISAQKYAYWSFQSTNCFPLQYNQYKRATARKSVV